MRFPFFYSTAFFAASFAAQIRQRDVDIQRQRLAQAELQEAYRRLEETQSRLLESEKLAAVGILASGIAHELNNPLTSIFGFSEILLKETDIPSRHHEDIKTICTQSERCRHIIQGLLRFARAKPVKKISISIGELLEKTLDLVRYDLKTSAVELVLGIPPKLPLVFGELSQLQQVFLNIITNAKQALRPGHPGRIAILAKLEGDKVCIRVEDNGFGILERDIGRIFDPFFTTKPIGQGTGLGLSISHGIVQEHGGSIRVQSNPGEGSAFMVELPIFQGGKL